MKGSVIKEILRREGFTQAQVAKLIGESQQNFSAALGQEDVRTGLVERIARAIDRPVSLFYGDTNIATASGKNASAVAGNNNQVNTREGEFLKEISAQRRLTEKSQEQIDRLLGVIEKLSTK